MQYPSHIYNNKTRDRTSFLSFFLSFLFLFLVLCSTDPLHVCGNAANLEDKTKQIFAFNYRSVLQIGCIPTDVQGVYCSFCSFMLH